MDPLLFVDELARDYKARGENSRCWSDYLKAHGLANYCVALDPRDERHQLVYDIEESWYQGKHPLTYNEHRDMTRRHKEALASYRSKVKEEFDNLQPKETSLSFSEIFSETNKSLLVDFTQDIFRVSEMCTDGFVGVTRKIIEASVAVLERVDMKAPCHFSVCALGSVAKGEVTPYSDLEYAFIVECDDEYFTRLAVDTYFRVGNIGESPLSTFDIRELRESGPLAELETVGFRIDGIKEKAGNIPTGRVGGQRLTLTVEGFMELYSTAAKAPFDGMAGDKSDMISSLSLVYSSQGSECPLYSGLKSAIARYEESLGSVLVDKKRFESFSHDIDAYNYGPENSSTHTATGTVIKVKPYIFRYPTLLANNIRVCLNLSSSFSWNTFTTLKERSIISEDIHFYLTVAIALSIYIRTKVYMSLKSQSELVSLFTSSVPDDPRIYHVPQNLFLILGYFTIPIKRCIRQSLRQRSVNEGVDLKEIVGSMVSSIVVDRDDFMLQVELLYFVEDFRGAIGELSKVFGSNIESVSCESFLEVLRSKYNTTKSDEKEVIYLELVAWTLRNGGCYKTSFDYYSLLASYSTDPLSMAMLTAYSGDCQSCLGNLKEAEALLEKSFALLKQAAGLEVHADILQHDILQHFESKITSNKDISEVELNILEHLAFVFHRQGDLYEKPNYYNIKSAYKATAASVSTQRLMLSVHRRDEGTGAYPEIDIGSLPGSIDVGKCSTQELRCLNEIALSFVQLSDLVSETNGERSLLLGTKALSLLRAIHTADTNHPAIANCLRSVGAAYKLRGDIPKALLSYNEALQMYEALGCPSEVGNCYNDLGITHSKQRDYSAALMCHRKALEKFKVLYGANSNHREIATNYDNIGSVYSKMGDYDAALEYSKNALDMRKAVFGADSNHPHIAHSYNNIGDVHYRKGENRTAVAYHNVALKMYQAVYGVDRNHPDIVMSHLNIARCCYKLGDYVTSLSHLLKRLEMLD